MGKEKEMTKISKFNQFLTSYSMLMRYDSDLRNMCAMEIILNCMLCSTNKAI